MASWENIKNGETLIVKLKPGNSFNEKKLLVEVTGIVDIGVGKRIIQGRTAETEPGQFFHLYSDEVESLRRPIGAAIRRAFFG
ncbi:MAG: hypothetical protein AAB573_01125 [Patescibacteria group bacterium]